MGRIAFVQAAEHLVTGTAKNTTVTIDPGGGSSVTASQFSALGDDSLPLITDNAITVSTAGEGTVAIVGYLDPINTRKTAPGERRIYARDASTGISIGELFLKNDGTIVIANENGKIELQPDGGIILENDSGSYGLQADGSHIGENNNGSYVLQADGKFVVNGTAINTNGDIVGAGGLSTVGDITGGGSIQDGNGTDLTNHDHDYLLPSSPAGTGQTGDAN